MNQHPRAHERNKWAANHLSPEGQKALGTLATLGKTRWEPAPSGFHKALPHIYLGETSKRRVDSIETAITEAGFVFISAQFAHGWTGIKARPLPNCAVEAAQLNDRTGKLRWAKAPRNLFEVIVAADEGRIHEVPSSQWETTNLGNPGIRAGIIRVCDEHDRISHYGLTAEFEGEPDEWRVTRTVTELQRLR